MLRSGIASPSEVRLTSARRSAKRIHDILDRIHVALIAGAVPRHDLQHLLALLAAWREQPIDPRLAVVIDEIDLREQVKITKHMRSA